MAAWKGLFASQISLNGLGSLVTNPYEAFLTSFARDLDGQLLPVHITNLHIGLLGSPYPGVKQRQHHSSVSQGVRFLVPMAFNTASTSVGS